MSNKQLVSVEQKLPIANCILSVFFNNCRLPIAYCTLPIAYCLLPISYKIAYHAPIKKLLLVVGIIISHFAGYSQHTIMQTFNINDGLVSNQVRGFYQDQRGFIWIMTWEGLSRYDGHSFRNYTGTEGLAHPMINAMFQRQDGKIGR